MGVEMSDQLNDLLQRVYDEGVNKAKAEAEEILAKAQNDADGIVANAKQVAEKTIESAKVEAQNLKKNSESDLRAAAQSTLSAVKQELTEALLDQAFDSGLKAGASDPELVKTLILEVVSAWKESGGTVTVSKSLEAKLENILKQALPQAAAQGLKVKFSPTLKNGFSIAPADGSYKLSFTDEDFANLFKSYLRPRSNSILFKQ
jgi:V/A-type H+-transporting ATPase subunit E